MRSKHKKQPPKGSRLAGVVLEYLLLSLALAAFIFCFLYFMSCAAAELYLTSRQILLDEIELEVLRLWLRSLCLIASAGIFLVIFLALLGQRIAYLVSIIQGVKALEANRMDFSISPEGDDELTDLAEAIHFLTASQRELARKEQELAEERNQWVRSMSHDIRTPLTSILSYSELLLEKQEIGQEEMKAYISMVQARAIQIRELTDRLLGKRSERKDQVENVRFLMEQLAGEWEELLEEAFSCETSLSRCEPVSGRLRILELRRIFDNLISNVEKYADPAGTVELEIAAGEEELVIIQRNRIRDGAFGTVESHQIGLDSIRKLVEDDGGDMEISRKDQTFEIRLRLPVGKPDEEHRC